MTALVLVYEPDLLFSSRIESVGAKFGLEVRTVTTTNALRESLKGILPKLLLVNLDALDERHESSKELVSPGSCRLIGYYSHVETESAEEALKSGFELVVPRRAFTVKLNEIFAKANSS